MNTSETEQAQEWKMLICAQVLVLLLASWSSFRVKQTSILILVHPWSCAGVTSETTKHKKQ